MLRVVTGGNGKPMLGAGMGEKWFGVGEVRLVPGVGPAPFQKRARGPRYTVVW